MEKVIGSNVNHNSGFSSHPTFSDLVYPAGSVAILYNVKKGKQTQFFSRGKSNPIVSLSFSPDGKYLLTGEVGSIIFIFVSNELIHT